MKNCELQGIFYFDSTYKITIQSFLLEVFGVSDMHGHFNPTALMLTNNEKQIEFSCLFFIFQIYFMCHVDLPDVVC